MTRPEPYDTADEGVYGEWSHPEPSLTASRPLRPAAVLVIVAAVLTIGVVVNWAVWEAVVRWWG